MVRLGGDRALEQVLCGHFVEDAEPGEAFRIELRGLGARGQGRLDGGRVRRRDGGQLQLVAQLRARAGGERVEIRRRALFGDHGDRLAGGGVLQSQVEADRAAGVAGREVRAEQDEIRTGVAADARERLFPERVGVAEAEIALHPRDVFARDGPELLARRELGRQHLRERRRDPGFLGLPGEILEAEDGDGAARAERTGPRRVADRRARNGSPARPRRARSPP